MQNQFIVENKEGYQPPENKTRFFYGYIVVLAAFFIQILMFGPRSSFGVFFKPIMNEFGWTRALISGAFSISSIMQGFSSIAMGNLNDRTGPRVVMTLCGLLVGIGYLLTSQINAAWQLYLLYVVAIGTGWGGIYTPITSMVARWFVKRRSLMTGIVLAGAGISGIILPPVINWLIATYGWRNSYLILGAFSLILIILAAQFLRRDPTQKGQLPYGYQEGQEQKLDLVTKGLTFKAATHTRQFWMLAAMAFCFGFCFITIMIHIVPHATDLGISATTAAYLLAARSGAGLVSCVVLGSVADRIGNRQAFTICFILMSAAMFWLLTAREALMLYLFSIIFGFGTGGAATIEAPLVAELFGTRSHGSILGVVVFGYTIGSAIGPFMAGYIFDISGSYQSAFLITAVICVIGLILGATLRPIKRPDLSHS